MGWRLTRFAERDVAHILRESRDLFGPDQATRYAALLMRTFDLAAEQPDRPNSHERPEFGPSDRSLHVVVAAGRWRGAAHVVYYRSPIRSAGQVLILRVLHERMDPRRRVLAALDELKQS